MRRPKRDEHGRRLAGEWDKRFEREGTALITRLNERGDGIEDIGQALANGDNNNELLKRKASSAGKSTSTKLSRSKSRRSRRRRRARARAFSQPNLGTLERFEKVSPDALLSIPPLQHPSQKFSLILSPKMPQPSFPATFAFDAFSPNNLNLMTFQLRFQSVLSLASLCFWPTKLLYFFCHLV